MVKPYFGRGGGLWAALVVVLSFVCAMPLAARAQNSSAGTITGQVTDQQGKAIVGAVVVLTNTATNAAQPVVSNGAGRYAYPNVAPGTYSLDVKKDGFKEAVIKSQTVAAGKALTINVPMQVGAATQTVEVTATGAELQTMNATVGETLGADAILKLPNLNRDANSLTALQPNTQPDGGVGGADSDQNSFTLNGANNSNDMDGNNADYTPTTGAATSGVIPTPAESVETFTVGISNQSADVNSAAGSSVAMVTKRGTDTLHGSVYEYYLGSYLGANDWTNNAENNARPKSHRNRFGATLGGEILPNWLGGKTYLFGDFEALRFPSSVIFSRAVPTALLRAGVVQASNGSSIAAYNLNATSVTVGGTSYAPAVCNLPGGGTGACDPRGLGLNPVIAALWSKYMPLPNQTTGGDHHNTLNYAGNVDNSLKSNFLVMRMDHDFGAKNHLDAVYNFYSYNPITLSQVDIGGALPGDTLGKPKATTQRPELPSMTSVNLSSSLSSNVTNNFNYSYLRHYWEWLGSNVSPQAVPGFGPLGGALEIGGESNSNVQIPYNVNTQNVRTRWWDGIGNTFADNLSVIHGNHLFSIGGKYTHQWDYHSRNDNGGGIMAANIYQIGNGRGQAGGGGVNFDYLPTDFVSGADSKTFKQFYAEALGIVTQPQSLYTRSGPKLTLQPLGTHAYQESNIPLYNAYFSDAWHIKPSVTFTYGAGYTVEMPPHEKLGRQVALVDGGGQPIDQATFLGNEERAALNGQVYPVNLGFATVPNIGGGLKYPYQPFYGGFSPRVSLAWNPNVSGGLLGSLFGGNKTVIRGGWSRIYGRLNGVDLVLVPLLGTGLMQPVECIGATKAGSCLGNGGADPNSAFRIGADGLSAPLGPVPVTNLPQPYYPGVVQNGVPNPGAGSGEFLDPHFRPNRSDEFDLTIQRQFTPQFTMEVGYTGRVIRNEYQAINLAAVPTMFTAGGQRFDKAFAALYQQMFGGGAITAQPFFETALGGPTSAYCQGFSSCTAAVAANEGPSNNDNIDNQSGNNVYGMWADLNGDPSWTLGRTWPSAPTAISGGGQVQAIFDNASNGYGNYNSLFWSVSMRNFHGLTAQSNLTWAHSLGTGQVDQATSSYSVTNPWDLHVDYGPQFDSTPLNYNVYFVYEPGAKTQQGLIGHLAHGWSFAPILTYHRIGNNFGAGGLAGGGYSQVGLSDCGSFGEVDCNAGSAIEGAITGNYTGGAGIVRGIPSSAFAKGGALSVVGSNSKAFGINRFANPAAILAEFRPMVLGLDTTAQSGVLPGLSATLVDFSVTKDLAISERFHTELNGQATNLFNHFVPSENYPDLGDPTNFGVIGGSAVAARTVELGITVRW